MATVKKSFLREFLQYYLIILKDQSLLHTSMSNLSIKCQCDVLFTAVLHSEWTLFCNYLVYDKQYHFFNIILYYVRPYTFDINVNVISA